MTLDYSYTRVLPTGEQRAALLWAALDRIPDRILRLGLSGLGRLMPAATFPELQPHRDLPPQRVIVNSAPSEPDNVNRAHQRFSRLFPHGRRALNCRTVGQMVEQVLGGLGDRPLHELTFYGHGRPGAMEVGDEELSLESIRPGGAHHQLMQRLRERLGPDAVLYLRGCECLQGERGRQFGQELANLLGCRVVGHTQVIGGPSRGGEVSYRP